MIWEESFDVLNLIPRYAVSPERQSMIGQPHNGKSSFGLRPFREYEIFGSKFQHLLSPKYYFPSQFEHWQFHSIAYSSFDSLQSWFSYTILLRDSRVDILLGDCPSHIFENPPIRRGSRSMIRLLMEQRVISVFGSLERALKIC